MKGKKRWLSLLLTVLMTVALCAVPVSANSAQPPGLTVLVSMPPEDLEITLRFEEETSELMSRNKQ